MVTKYWQTYLNFRLTMLKLRSVFLLAATTAFFMITILPEATEASCWETWSRYTQWSKFFTGKLWWKCDPYCRCLGRSGGRCVISKSTCPFADKAWSCHCYGSYGPRQRWCRFWVIKTHLKDHFIISKWIRLYIFHKDTF